MNTEHLKTALPILLLVSLLILLGWNLAYGIYLNRIGSRGRASITRLLRTFRWAMPLSLLASGLLLHGTLARNLVEATFGRAAAQRSLAMGYFSGGDLLPQDRARARIWLTRAADQGDREAEYTLAQMWLGGTGGGADPATALRWARAAATRHHPLAMVLVGEILMTHPDLARPGESAKQVFEQARPSLQFAAVSGDAQAMFSLGRMLTEGWGSHADPVEGYRWLLRANVQGLDPFKQIYVQSAGQRLSPQQQAEASEHR